jgi:hypothetical protein
MSTGRAGGSGSRSCTTTVPATMSPNRLPLRLSKAVIKAALPPDTQISGKTANRPRASACRNPIGPPSSRTTRNPNASLPSVRPRVRVSIVTG